MVKKLSILLAFLAMFGQALAVATPGIAGTGWMDHLLLHVQADVHHHHDAGDLHVDAPNDSADSGHSGESSFHLHVDSANAQGLPSEPLIQPAPPAPAGPPALRAQAWPTRAPDGLLRPPRLPA